METRSAKEIKPKVKKARIWVFRRLISRVRLLETSKGSPHQLAKNERKRNKIKEQIDFLKKCSPDELVKMTLETALNSKEPEKPDSRSEMEKIIVTMLMKTREMQEILNSNFETSTKGRKKMAKKKRQSPKEPGSEVKAAKVRKKQSRKPKKLSKKETNEKQDKNIKLHNKKEGNDPSKRVTLNDDEISLSDEEMSGHSKFAKFESMFVASMAELAHEDIKKRNGKNKKKKDAKRKNGKRNRLGQRERRKQWLKQYGQEANHLRQGKDKCFNPKTNKQNHSVKAKPNRAERRKDYNQNESMHPSWEASRKKKQKESVLVPFEGKKITFDD